MEVLLGLYRLQFYQRYRLFLPLPRDQGKDFGGDGPVLPRQLLVRSLVKGWYCRFQGQGEGSCYG